MVEKAAVSPTPSSDKAQDVAPGKLPKVVQKGGKPTGLDFSGISKPSPTTPVQRAVLKKGTGATVKATDTVTVNYLGAVYGAKAPFDESYTKQPLTSPLAGLVKGWAIGLEGVKVGSRVLIQIPGLRYGAQGSGETIPPNSPCGSSSTSPRPRRADPPAPVPDPGGHPAAGVVARLGQVDLHGDLVARSPGSRPTRQPRPSALPHGRGARCARHRARRGQRAATRHHDRPREAGAGRRSREVSTSARSVTVRLRRTTPEST